MKRVSVTTVLAVISPLLIGHHAFGAEINPPGSYQNTCANASVESLVGGPGKNLQADCQNRKGVYVRTFLRLPCRGDIRNDSGTLTCAAGPNPFAPPPGSYTRNCRDIQLQGPILVATCTGVLPKKKHTSINTINCKGRDIHVRFDGELAC